MLKCSPLSARGQFGSFLAERKLNGRAVEVGTHRGEFAEMLLRTWPDGERLYCIDPWSCPPGYEMQTKFLWGGTQEEALKECQRVLKRYGDRAELMRTTSADAVRKFADNSLVFVYVDGDHRKREVLFDLQNWWMKLKSGGIMAGHDFIQPGESHSWAGHIQQAVIEFSEEMNLDVQLIVEEGGLPWSYFMEKP